MKCYPNKCQLYDNYFNTDDNKNQFCAHQGGCSDHKVQCDYAPEDTTATAPDYIAPANCDLAKKCSLTEEGKVYCNSCKEGYALDYTGEKCVLESSCEEIREAQNDNKRYKYCRCRDDWKEENGNHTRYGRYYDADSQSCVSFEDFTQKYDNAYDNIDCKVFKQHTRDDGKQEARCIACSKDDTNAFKIEGQNAVKCVKKEDFHDDETCRSPIMMKGKKKCLHCNGIGYHGGNQYLLRSYKG